MQNIVDKFISEKDEKGIILELYEKGLKQNEIEKLIINKFKPYLKNKNILRVYVLAYLPQYIDSLLYISSDNEMKFLFERCLEIFWKAKEKDLDNCYKSYQYWQEDVLAATSKIISLITLDQDRSKMNLHEFAEDIFTKIGKIIEACIQPYLRILLFLENIINNRNPSKIGINKLDLGDVINKLYKYKIMNELLIPAPWNLKLNDWRNIPKHDKYSIKDNKIVCRYKKPPKQKEIILLQPELWKLFLCINDIFAILRLAHSVFFLDNINDIPKYWENMQLREESELLDQISVYGMFGFSVKDYSIEENKVKFKLIDKTNSAPDTRLNQLLFLIRPTWYKTRKKIIILEYFNSQNSPIFQIEVDTSKREDIFSLNVDEEILTIENIKECINLTDLRDLKMKKTRNII